MEKGYLIKERSPHDKRSTRVKLSDKGLALCQKIDELYKRNVDALRTGKPNINSLADVNITLSQLEQFWTGYINSV